MIYDLHPRDRNEPTIVLVTFLGKWDRSNMSGGQLWERNGRRETGGSCSFGLWGKGTPGVLPSSDCKPDS